MFIPKLKIFKNEFKDLRMVYDKDGHPWFLATDVAAQIDVINASDTIKNMLVSKRIDREDVCFVTYKECKKEGLDDFWKSISSGENDYSNKVFVNEYAFYTMTFSATKEAARNFQRWVAKEVLPRINKDGGYVLGVEDLQEKDQEEISKKISALESEVAEKSAKVKKMSRVCAEADDMYEKLASENAILYAELMSVKESTSEKFRKVEERAKKVTANYEGLEGHFSLKDSLVTFGKKKEKYRVKEFPEER